MIGRYHSKISTILRLLETDKLFHPQLFVQHPSGDVRHSQYIRIGEVLGDIPLTKYFADISEQRCVQFFYLRQPTDGNEFHGLSRQFLLQTSPDPLCFLLVRCHLVDMVTEQRQRIALSQQFLWLFFQAEGIEHRRQQPVHRPVK